MDDEVDEANRRMFDILQDLMHRDPSTIERSSICSRPLRYLERIADLATNIAQDVVYMAEGLLIRHPTEEEVILMKQAAEEKSRRNNFHEYAMEKEARYRWGGSDDSLECSERVECRQKMFRFNGRTGCAWRPKTRRSGSKLGGRIHYDWATMSQDSGIRQSLGSLPGWN